MQALNFKVKVGRETKDIIFEGDERSTTGDLLSYFEKTFAAENAKIIGLKRGFMVQRGKNDNLLLNTFKIKAKHKLKFMHVPRADVEKINVQAAVAEAERLEAEQERLAQEEWRRQREQDRLKELEQREKEAAERWRQENSRRIPQIAMPGLGRLSTGDFIGSPIDDLGQEVGVEGELRVKQGIDSHKVQLSASVLNNLIRSGTEMPVIFRLSIFGKEKFCYASVLDFDGPDGSVTIGPKLANQLDGKSGNQIGLKVVKAEACTFAEFLPSNAQWFLLPLQERRAILEFQLRNDHILQKNQILTIQYCDFFMDLKIVTLRAASGEVEVARTIDVDLSYEVSRPDAERFNRSKSQYIVGDLTYLKGDNILLEGALGKIETIPGSVLTTDEQLAMDVDEKSDVPESPRQPDNGIYGVRALCQDKFINVPIAELTRLHPTAEQEYQTLFVEEKSEKMELSEPKYFVSILDPQENNAIEITARVLSKHDVDLYILAPGSIEGSLWQTPGPNRFTWKDESRIGSASVKFDTSDVNYVPGTYKICVLPRDSMGKPCELQLLIEKGKLTSKIEVKDNPDTKQCEMCRKMISKAAYTMHEMRCSRLNWRCPECSLVFPKVMETKHILVTHKLQLPCSCGLQLQPSLLRSHYDDCFSQLVQCQFCPMKMLRSNRGDHQGECMKIKSICRECSQTIRRQDMKRHLVREHNMTNPTWRDWWE